MLTADEVKFLKELQDKLNTQETFCQADPRFWVVEQDRWYTCPKGYEGCDTMTLGQGVKAVFSSIQAKFSSEDATECLSNWGHNTCRRDNVIYLNRI